MNTDRRLVWQIVETFVVMIALLGFGLGGAAGGANGASVLHGSAASIRSAGCGHHEQVGMLQVGSDTLLSIPRHYNERHPYRLVLVFYGFNSNPTQFANLTGLPDRGVADGDIVVVPHTTGTESEWQFSGSGSDAAYVQNLIDSLEQTYCIDQRQVFATGFSAGAAFTVIYACSHPGQIAAIATVAVDFQLGCTKPIPIMAFHGTADPAVPYVNGAIGLSLPGIKVRGTQLNMGDWARLDHCAASAQSSRIGSQVREQLWRGCAKGTGVTLFSIAGGGHTWPGADPHQGLGLTTQQVHATGRILAFFRSVRNRS